MASAREDPGRIYRIAGLGMALLSAGIVGFGPMLLKTDSRAPGTSVLGMLLLGCALVAAVFSLLFFFEAWKERKHVRREPEGAKPGEEIE